MLGRDEKGRFIQKHLVPEEWIESMRQKKIGKPSSKKNKTYEEIYKERAKIIKEKLKQSHLGLMKGEKHWNWKGGITAKNRLLRHTENYKKWQKAVFRRDYWTCQVCNKKIKHPIAHHIKSVDEHPELIFDIDNGVTVCRSCHKIIHYEIGMNTRFPKNRKGFG